MRGSPHDVEHARSADQGVVRAFRRDVVGERPPGAPIGVETEQLVHVAHVQAPAGRGHAQADAPAAAANRRNGRGRQGPGPQVQPLHVELRPAGRHAPGQPDGVLVDGRGKGMQAQGCRLDHRPGHRILVEVGDEHVVAPVLGRHGGRAEARTGTFGHRRGRPSAEHPEPAPDDHRRVVRPARRHRRQVDPPLVRPVPALQVGAGPTGARDLGAAHAVEVLAVADENRAAYRIAGPDRLPRRVRRGERMESRLPGARGRAGGGRLVSCMHVEHVADVGPGRVRRRVREGRRGLGRQGRHQGGLRVRRHAGAIVPACSARQDDRRQHGGCCRDASHGRLQLSNGSCLGLRRGSARARVGHPLGVAALRPTRLRARPCQVVLRRRRTSSAIASRPATTAAPR